MRDHIGDCFVVFYLSDFSVAGYFDRQFKTSVKWDNDLLSGYEHSILDRKIIDPKSKFWSLNWWKFPLVLIKNRPSAVVFSQWNHLAEIVALIVCVALRIRIFIRMETQDQANERSKAKQFIRRLVYMLSYKFVDHAFCIGSLNRQHLIQHGLAESRISPAFYTVHSPLLGLTELEKQSIRSELRSELGIHVDAFVVLFVGKLIEKKDPLSLLQAASSLSERLRERTVFVFIGSGNLQDSLVATAQDQGLDVRLLGFINQSDLSGYYLAGDMLVLPSKRMGETWGLVVNEALHGGCSVAMSNAVGCGAEFRDMERCRVFPVGDPAALGRSIEELSKFPRSFDWSASHMQPYEMSSVARKWGDKLVSLIAKTGG